MNGVLICLTLGVAIGIILACVVVATILDENSWRD